MLVQNSMLFAALLLAVATTDASRIKGATINKARRLKKIGGPQHRECDISEKRNEVRFECKSKPAKHGSKDDELEATDRGINIVPDADIKDKIKYKIKTSDDGISVKLEYKNEIEMDDTETETKTKFELLFLELVEYVKAPDAETDIESQAYDWDQDEIVQTIPLTEWLDMDAVIDDAEGVVSYFTATTEQLGLEGGTASFNFTISRANQGESITANSMKIDVRILDFPWTRTDSYVALMSTLESEKKVKVEYEKEATIGHGHAKKAKDVLISFGEDMEETFGFSTYGQYTWADEAEANGSNMPFNGTVMMARQGGADGVVMVGDNMTVVEETETSSTIEVIATSPTTESNENAQSIAYSFVGSAAQGASDIYWDPEAGIGYESGVARQSLLVGLVGTALISMLSIMA